MPTNRPIVQRLPSLAWLLPAIVVAVCLLLALWDPVPLQMLRNGQFDQFQRWQPRVDTGAPVRIIDIDDDSLNRDRKSVV